ncbi:hypothetical protein D3C78_1869490 [compost metagenome]
MQQCPEQIIIFEGYIDKPERQADSGLYSLIATDKVERQSGNDYKISDIEQQI